ncbi:H-type lectin domain-containing protein [Albidovulum sediminicola]|uniref:H-type lectin domain-containing protein n=1 Tax=Albidovulum sediminicola TaxID=2984331 RepID=A0ABT2Z5S2_9RHOB|nr:H-type lectin domain-containing protein [Defluviimonas sp. WL0075]MCV2866447.1 H-type lectin domain-containing protein [Defluviimonas sp. WL0075]
MRRFTSNMLGVERGSIPLFSDFEAGGPMWTGTGPREVRRYVGFSEAFRDVPIVQVTLNMWDVHHAANMRAEILSENVTPEGFDMVFRTWGDTRIARMHADWLALGEVSHADNWDIG